MSVDKKKLTINYLGSGERNFNPFSSCSFFYLLGGHHIKATTYRLCSNGIVEMFHTQLKIALSMKTNLHSRVDNLPLLLFSIRNVVKELLG